MAIPMNQALGSSLSMGSSIPTPAVPQAEQLSLQRQANALVELTGRAHELLDRLSGAPAQGQVNGAETNLGGALQMTGESLMRLNNRLEDLQRYVGTV